MRINILITKVHPAAVIPTYGTDPSAGFDLYTVQHDAIGPKDIKLLRTGLVMAIPEGMFIAMIARSSLPLKRGLMLANSVGVVDADYRGPQDELHMMMYNFTDRWIEVKPGERLAQCILLPCPKVEFVEVSSENWPYKNRGGYGSTGQ